MKDRLFSVTKDDFDFQFFRAGGPGGQNQNKVSSACRCTHTASGAVGVARDSRDQKVNRQNAFIRCVQSGKFRAWLNSEIRIRLREESIEDKIDRWMEPQNLRIEIQGDRGEWIPMHEETI